MSKTAKHSEEAPAKAPAGTTATAEENEEHAVERRISELEAELATLDGPPAPLTATDIAQGAVALLDVHEQRCTTAQRLLTAFQNQALGDTPQQIRAGAGALCRRSGRGWREARGA